MVVLSDSKVVKGRLFTAPEGAAIKEDSFNMADMQAISEQSLHIETTKSRIKEITLQCDGVVDVLQRFNYPYSD